MKTKQTTYHAQPPGRFAAQMDAASERDRRYFARHRGTRTYVRERIVGEFGAAEDSPDIATATHVEVTQISPHCRIRTPIWMLRRQDYPAGKLPLEHVEAFIDRAVSAGGQWRFIGDDEMDDDLISED